ncbi:transcription antitermination factor NusB [Selenomonas caprae]|jgi:N utilization substance protein B|uniref:Transcription antitermination protein NusB n=2 Tax=Selenomonas TaxID=970 RepID=A0A1I3D6Z9_SELRU|nr:MULTISPECIES: transcription antitermination factor NusB [Selenomonas]MBE6075125.1 transcription antitermination factor NusB [Selenomonas ruminantium]TYZ30197.1 transcription antitermination factor NusB [Selenomonas caprae]SFH82379.1 NusB antitermination factor [Selenomonas ruminantium]
MSRRQAREAALQALFQLDLNQAETEEQQGMYETLAIDTALSEAEKMSAHDRSYVQTLVQGTRANLAAIDALISESSKDWKIERMAAVDRNLVRMAIFEIKFSEEKLTPNIAINEAVELAKKYGTDDSSRYVNGILGAMMKIAH